MNFLAHTFLSCQDEDLLVGNFMADFINNKEKDKLKPSILRGIMLHKQIDAYTDSHDAVKSAIRIVRASQGKYAPVTVDILFDYMLTKDWDRYSMKPLDIFTKETYAILTAKIDEYPAALQERLPRMIADDFLMSCSSEERLTRTFTFVKKRAKFDNNFEGATQDMFSNYTDLHACFTAFFPDLVTHVGGLCACE